ncbi:MAG: hypothetical protein LBR38_06565 [Synergistaceae bacterium]|jgi:hypothetical protein|nr:hypothetical protein [Synergistaceae bacterium]
MAKGSSAFTPAYDFMSKERYVDSSSFKTEFDRVLDEIASISDDLLAWEILKLTKLHFGDRDEDKARKMEAFLGAFIIKAASALFDRGQSEAAYRRLDEARAVLDAKGKLTDEADSIRMKLEETRIDVSDLLGLFNS